MRRRALLILSALTLALCSACSRVRSPLTPGLDGSIGLPHLGVLSTPVELPRTGTGYQWFNPAGNHFGTRELVDTVQFAASEVARQRPGSPRLQVGDLSGRRGGRLPHHASHRTGRDVDLLFFTKSLSGAPIASPGFLQFGPDGLASLHPKKAGPYVQFDVERNWLLVKALVEAPGPGVTWLFVSRPIEALLTEYAFARGEDPVLVWHAETVMLQPRNALPHDDHFHLRIACSPEMEVRGCEGGGPQWSWLPASPGWNGTDDDLIAAIDPDSLPPIEPSTNTTAAAP